MRSFCMALPEDRLVHGYDHDLDTILRKTAGTRTYTIPGTKAKVTYRHAVEILARYGTSLVRRNDESVVCLI